MLLVGILGSSTQPPQHHHHHKSLVDHHLGQVDKLGIPIKMLLGIPTWRDTLVAFIVEFQTVFFLKRKGLVKLWSHPENAHFFGGFFDDPFFWSFVFLKAARDDNAPPVP